jgi:alpha-methylacyl-CoA racemase
MEPQFYAELCARLGVSVPQDDTLDAWSAHGDTMAARFREKTRAEWESVLVTPQSCASPVLGLAEVPNHPHSRARGTFVTVDGVVQPAPAPRFSRTAPPAPSPPSLPGDHTLGILAEFGLADTDFVDTGAVRQSAAH